MKRWMGCNGPTRLTDSQVSILATPKVQQPKNRRVLNLKNHVSPNNSTSRLGCPTFFHEKVLVNMYLAPHDLEIGCSMFFDISCHYHAISIFVHGGQRANWVKQPIWITCCQGTMKVASAAGPELKMTSMDRNFNQPVI